MTPVIELESVARTYRVGPVRVAALRAITLRVEPGEFVAITGPSGSGKSTLLNLLGLLDQADEGVYRLDGRDVAACGDDELTLLRNRKIGFVFQSAPMLARLTVRENVAVPLVYRGLAPRHARVQADQILERLQLSALAGHRPAELSGGQQQRVAVARALVGRPRLILADEPTAALDAATADAVMGVVLEHARETDAALVMITHSPTDAARAHRRLLLEAGQLAETDTASQGSALAARGVVA